MNIGGLTDFMMSEYFFPLINFVFLGWQRCLEPGYSVNIHFTTSYSRVPLCYSYTRWQWVN